jgi:hypothetical protein
VCFCAFCDEFGECFDGFGVGVGEGGRVLYLGVEEGPGDVVDAVCNEMGVWVWVWMRVEWIIVERWL